MKAKKRPATPVNPPASRKLPDELPTRAPGGYLHRSFVFYGRSGTGKTTVSSTFPGPILHLDVKDSGDDSISDVDKVKVMDIKSWEDFEMAYWWLIAHPGKYKTIVIDTMSQLQQLAIRKVLEDKNKDADRAGDWGVMTKREWGDVAALMKAWIINVRDLPMQTVFIAQDRTFNVGEEDEAAGLEPEVGPGLSPSIAKALNAAVHFIANTFIRRRRVKIKNKDPKRKPGDPKFIEKEKIEFCCRIGPNAIYITKVRKPKHLTPPDVMVNPTYDAFMALMTGSEKSDGKK